jgi:uncharacterized membrane protein YGL010W
MTTKLDQLLAEYAISHQNKTNQIIHKICVPAIMFSILGLLWAIPTPAFMQTISLNFAIIFVLIALFYYFSLSFKYSIAMLILSSIMLVGNYYLSQTNYLLSASVLIFVISWIFQFIGHKIEGKKPSFFQDVFFLLIGPLWVLKALVFKKY